MSCLNTLWYVRLYFVCCFFPMISPWYVPLSSQPRPYHKSNTGKHEGKKLACEKCIFMNYWSGDFTCVVFGICCSQPSLFASLQARGLHHGEQSASKKRFDACPPKYPVVATSAQWAHLFWIFCAMNRFFVSGQDLGKTRRRDENKNTLYFRSIMKHPWFQHRWMRSPICVVCTFLRYPKMPKTICFCAPSS